MSAVDGLAVLGADSDGRHQIGARGRRRSVDEHVPTTTDVLGTIPAIAPRRRGSAVRVGARRRAVAVALVWMTAMSLPLVVGATVMARAHADPATASDECLPAEHVVQSTESTPATSTWAPTVYPTDTWTYQTPFRESPTTTTTLTTETPPTETTPTETTPTETTPTETTPTETTPTETTPTETTPTTTSPLPTFVLPRVAVFVQPAASVASCGSAVDAVPWVTVGVLLTLAVLLGAGLFWHTKRRRGPDWLREHVTVTTRPAQAPTADIHRDDERLRDHAFSVVATNGQRHSTIEENRS
ncbi:hypothetical protein A5724_27640 [Mycobacterium sp. ACS1612]|uniref:hypothetical protein n=1 Tax=Mycobacterium sp. ACS1612 TaxID=1834117 RepID=UPI0007FFA515|nr:hypothetical protein [Mycobacterium sp. ACS1612]OBF28204.1 hypothetical protein A5724_27640 [Mycobacterium sp. ACS1612]